MSWMESIPGVGSIFTTVRDIIRNFRLDPNEADKLATQITVAFADIIKTELGSQYWLAANWRAVVMLLIAVEFTVKSLLGREFIQMDYVLFGLLVVGLLGYKLDGKVIEFIAQLFKFGAGQSKKDKEIVQ